MKAGDFIDCGNGLWNARGSFKIKGLVEVGTQASLVALGDGSFAWLDSITLEGEALARSMALTDGGAKVSAILNLHPFHTLHCEWANRHFPGAKLYGSARHKAKLPALPWESENVESAAVAARFADVDEIPLPPFWGGYRVVPEAIELWESRPSRLHDRARFVRSGDGWSRVRLAP
jgi:hypothetical protein